VKVRELFESEDISQEDLLKIKNENEYWDKSVSFILEKWNSEVTRLSPRQGSWVYSIREELVDKKALKQED
jgi:hypothetical protein